MGYIRHHAIIVTDWRIGAVAMARQYAKELGMDVSSIHVSEMNLYQSFCVFPDGSKEGWADSDAGDSHRFRLIKALDFNQVPYVCVEYGGDDLDKVSVEHLGPYRDESTWDSDWKDLPK